MEESLEKEGQKDQSWAGKMGLSFLNLREQDGQIFSMRADQEREQIQALRKNRYTYDNVKRIMIRNVVILVDLSRAMREKDIPFDIQREDHESAPPDASNFNSLPTEEDDINPILHRNERDFLLTRLDLTLKINCKFGDTSHEHAFLSKMLLSLFKKKSMIEFEKERIIFCRFMKCCF
eukprot:TRINITY_DN11373_c0_g1_i1.p2 TRINITY_DN11373_c0_g1~~TRINITY_DN11373_c0_g1_i1.p2  ORF type:complete len:178 (-),score=33.32 TRINITY_DN11373_c0_g1_i1:940-1473(-)